MNTSSPWWIFFNIGKNKIIISKLHYVVNYQLVLKLRQCSINCHLEVVKDAFIKTWYSISDSKIICLPFIDEDVTIKKKYTDYSVSVKTFFLSNRLKNIENFPSLKLQYTLNIYIFIKCRKHGITLVGVIFLKLRTFCTDTY